MVCSKYEQLTTIEKVIFIGQLHHAAMSDDEIFEMAQKIITLGQFKGLFENVEIMPERPKEDLFENIVLGKPVKHL